ncbi:uncharacterized protein LOC135195524 isoform X2 [Macrobrachium nipponense]|uniref:Serine proteinase-like protein n=1 Tax=Macrobrachium nipponense TaxID=159736 RepID=I1W6Q4_MACNP|nr:serine proteinase-like protein [Macrobrachium nipponense]
MDTINVFIVVVATFYMPMRVTCSEVELCGPHLVCVPPSRCGWKDLGDQKSYSCGRQNPSYVCCPVSHVSGETPGYGQPAGYSQNEVPNLNPGYQSSPNQYGSGFGRPGYSGPGGYGGGPGGYGGGPGGYGGGPGGYGGGPGGYGGGPGGYGGGPGGYGGGPGGFPGGPGDYGGPDRYGVYTESQGSYRDNKYGPSYLDFYNDQYEKHFGYTLSKQAKELLRNYRAKEECGVRNQSPADMARIATGYLHDYGFTSFAEFPWHVALLVEQRNFGYGGEPTYRYHCGATLIHRSLLITAAHCVRGILPHKLLAHLGEWNLQGTTGELFPAIKRKISKVFIHSGYNPGTYKNDIALLQMHEPVDTHRTPHIGPVCLPKADYELKDHSKCFIVGWGDDVYKPNFGSNILKSVSVTYALEKECTSRLYASLKDLDDKFTLDTDSQKCILGAYGKDACVGDGGGGVVCPLSRDEGPDVCNSPNCAHEHYFLFGVISYGSPVCGENSVTIITDVVKNLNWIYTLLEPAGGLKNYDHHYYNKGPGPFRPPFKGRTTADEEAVAASDVNATSTEGV